jgi:hypothetical protein
MKAVSRVADVTIPDNVYTAAELAANAEVFSGTEWHAPIYAAARAAVATFVGDRAVTALPKATDTDNEGDPLWDLGGNDVVIGYCDADGHPIIRLPDGDDAAPEWVELYAATLLAAARESRRLAAEFAENGSVHA